MRSHPLGSGDYVPPFATDRVRALGSDRVTDVTPLLPGIDVLVTDYSSLVYDSALVPLPVLFLAPDLSFLGYLAGPRVGAIAYNLAHAIAGPILLALAGLFVPYEPAMAVALIWLAHCGIDRALGYGLKYQAGFGFTHLGRIGRAA